ncbi:unnamed protein product [Sphenostylis stenocarpa]|uniref:Uncharacterized protein n=1 Tax=Sphenostylis stenocarpa TaxID=92480 RepID=A0AA86VHP7_9FABA|nr:unnamed protein product [Sphenostylis stenocarpa]
MAASQAEEGESGRYEIMKKKKKKMDRLAQKFVWTCEEGKGHSDTQSRTRSFSLSLSSFFLPKNLTEPSQDLSSALVYFVSS